MRKGSRLNHIIEMPMTDIRIIVASHKPYWMPEESIYLPVFAGAKGKESIGYTPDDSGDNISEKNPHYCELTALYWAWKNLPAEYLGLAHYRRHFTWPEARGSVFEKVISSAKLKPLLSETDIILPKPRNYFIETNYSQYIHAHHAADLDITREILSEQYPEYILSFDRSMKKTIGHRFNMFIMKRHYADAYCEWLFSILFALEKRLDITGYSPNDARVFGFVGERLLDVWIEANRLEYKELPYIFLEKENWIRKGSAFLLRKFGERK